MPSAISERCLAGAGVTYLVHHVLAATTDCDAEICLLALVHPRLQVAEQVDELVQARAGTILQRNVEVFPVNDDLLGELGGRGVVPKRRLQVERDRRKGEGRGVRAAGAGYCQYERGYRESTAGSQLRRSAASKGDYKSIYE